MTALAASIVIPTLGRPETLRTVLRALGEQTVPAGHYEVVVSVDGPAGPVPDVASEVRPSYTCQVIDGARRGRASACNAGLARAQGEIVILLDDDMEPVPEFVAAHLAAHREQPRRAVVGAVPVRTTAGDFPVAEYVATKFARHLEKLADPQHSWGLRDFYTGNFSIARPVFAEIGHFDTDFGLYGNEDLELFYRLRRAGIAVTFSRAALAWQRYGKPLEVFARDNWEKGRTAVQLAKKFPEAFAELKLSSYRTGPLPLRLARRSAIAIGRACPWLSPMLVATVGILERGAVPGRDKMYELLADYLYWMGAFTALDDDKAAGSPPTGVP